MRLIEFFPGEGSRYIVSVGVLTPTDATPIGGDEKTIQIAFGGEKTLRAGTFQCSPKTHPHLTASYMLQYLPGLDAAEAVAAHHVVAALLGREAIFPKHTPETLDWDANWKDQLEPLLQEIKEGLERNERLPRGRCRFPYSDREMWI